jgi:ribonuclease D
MEQQGMAGFDYKITPAQMRDLPEADYKGPIWLVSSVEQAEEVSRTLKNSRVLGFDTETRPSFKKGQVYPVALLQLATADDAYVFQLEKTGLPDDLVEVLANPKIAKAGIAVKGDIRELQAMKKFKAAGFVELGELTKKHKMKNHGLQGVAAALLGKRISKKEQLSNWSNPKLTEAQIKYAANDAWIGREIYLEMRKRGWIAEQDI